MQNITRMDGSWGYFETMLSAAGIKDAATVSSPEETYGWLAKVMTHKLMAGRFPEAYAKKRKAS